MFLTAFLIFYNNFYWSKLSYINYLGPKIIPTQPKDYPIHQWSSGNPFLILNPDILFPNLNFKDIRVKAFAAPKNSEFLLKYGTILLVTIPSRYWWNFLTILPSPPKSLSHPSQTHQEPHDDPMFLTTFLSNFQDAKIFRNSKLSQHPKTQSSFLAGIHVVGFV